MKILDCTTIDSMYNSLENIIGVTKEEIINFLDSHYNLDYYELYYDSCNSRDKLLLLLAQNKFNKPFEFDVTCWFHLTRVSESNKYKNGILPLGELIDELWNSLYYLVAGDFSEKKWNSFRKYVELKAENEFAHLYRIKLFHHNLWGPNAMLIRDVAFIPNEMSNHNYLEIPEIIEDICSCFDEKYGYDLKDKYIQNTSPCIVKFKSFMCELYCIGVVLLYLFNKRHEIRMDWNCNTTFDGKGSKVPFENIISIEYIKE